MHAIRISPRFERIDVHIVAFRAYRRRTKRDAIAVAMNRLSGVKWTKGCVTLDIVAAKKMLVYKQRYPYRPNEHDEQLTTSNVRRHCNGWIENIMELNMDLVLMEHLIT